MPTTLKAFRLEPDVVKALKAAAIKPTTQTAIVHRALRRELGLYPGPDLGGGASHPGSPDRVTDRSPAADVSTDPGFERAVRLTMSQNPDKGRAYAEQLVRQQRSTKR